MPARGEARHGVGAELAAPGAGSHGDQGDGKHQNTAAQNDGEVFLIDAVVHYLAHQCRKQQLSQGGGRHEQGGEQDLRQEGPQMGKNTLHGSEQSLL